LWWALPIICWPAAVAVLNLMAGHTGWGMCAGAFTILAALVALGEPQEAMSNLA
jgi:hypothetical protein